MQNVQGRSATEILRINKSLYEIFDKIQSCAYFIKKEFYVYGSVIQELISHDKLCNSFSLIEIIVAGSSCDLQEPLNKFCGELQKIYVHEKVASYKIGAYTVIFYFLPDFSPDKINDNGFTIDQVYYSIGENKIFDPTGRGLSDLSSEPPIIKLSGSTYNKKSLTASISKMGSFNSVIDQEDFLSFSGIKIDGLEYIYLVLWLNRPGASLRTLLKMFPDAQKWFFDALLKVLSSWKIPIKEDIKPSKILSEEKLKLLDLYSDYFNSSGSSYEKANKAKLLAKMLVDL